MSEPVGIDRVLWAELAHVGKGDGGEPVPDLREIYAQLGTREDDRALSALCLSGGGIRSATFNLGVLQALARLKLLEQFDYLSSVSGGGFVAGWLKAWLHREPLATVSARLADPAREPGFAPLAPEPKPVDHLREYSNYLTPRPGLLSADTWAAAAMIIRNLLLNWLVLVPVLTAVVAVPQVALIIATAAVVDATWGTAALALALTFALGASIAIYHLRRGRSEEMTVLLLGVLPLWLSAMCLAVAGLWLGGPFADRDLWGFSLLWCVFVPLAGWLVARVFAKATEAVPPATSDLAGVVLSGAVAALLLVSMIKAWLPVLQQHPRRFVLFTVPILLGLYLVARVLFVAFASLGEREARRVTAGVWTRDLGNTDREWWARLSGWVLILCLGWIAMSGLVLGGHTLSMIGGQVVAAVGGVTGLATALLGASIGTGSPGGPRHSASPVKEWLLGLLAPVTVAAIVLVLAELSAWAGRLITHRGALLEPDMALSPASVQDVVTLVAQFLIVPAGCTLLSWSLGWVVNVNRYSGHGFYRNRLVRAYLGASNPGRRPDPFTGFDRNDDVRLHEMAGGASPRPLCVINASLNLVRSSEHLAWQQRKAESFSMTPLYCGNFHEGYRRAGEYGGANGISLGTAMTISGAAANPSAGYHSSPLVSFLMTLFNVRLGAWLGNPNRHGEGVFRLGGPRHAWWPLFADLFSRTDSRHAYVSLSDGGHFENLAVYEMVLRRCRLIVASDAGQDPGYDFEDLGNLIRKVRIDFGIPIEFDRPIRILGRGAEGQPGLLCALGTIRYDLVDAGARPGKLLYLKPTLRAEGLPLPYDVFSYSRASKTFPHETTADQFFTEAQFESYRALGHHLAGQLAGGIPQTSLARFFAEVEASLVAGATTGVPAEPGPGGSGAGDERGEEPHKEER